MMNNLYNYQHSCKKDYDHIIEKSAPFFSKAQILRDKHNKQIIRVGFLSEGYYLWENNMHEAYNYGIRHINKSEFSIIEFQTCSLEKYKILNLCDSIGKNEFNDIIKSTIEKFPNAAKILSQGLGDFIHYLKFLNKKKDSGVKFEYCGIKCERVKIQDRGNIEFKKNIDYFLPLSAPIMICLFYNKTKIIFSCKKVYQYPESQSS